MVRRVPIEAQWRSDACGVTEPAQLVVRTPDEWARLWKTMHRQRLPTPPLPEVDFSRQLVIGVFLGERSSGGASVEITAVHRQGEELLAEARATEPSPAELHTMVLTQPCAVVAVTADPEARVRFQFR